MYVKGTSASTFAPPPVSPDVAATPAEENVSQQTPESVHFTPLLATNEHETAKRSEELPTEFTDEIPSEKNDDEVRDSNQAMPEQNISPIVDFPLQVSSSLKEPLVKDEKERKEEEEVLLPSDIAVHDADKEGSSDETETGADISDLKSFADDGASLPSAGIVPMPVVEEQVVPEATYIPAVDDKSIDLKEEKHERIASVEHGTQTDVNQSISVLNLGTTYEINKNEESKILNVKEMEEKINEILLDATVPADTQLLVKEAQTGSSVSSNIEIDATDSGNEPCVVTSQVSLAFVGLAQNDRESMTFIVPEKRPPSTEPDKAQDHKRIPHDRSSESLTARDDIGPVMTHVPVDDVEPSKGTSNDQKEGLPITEDIDEGTPEPDLVSNDCDKGMSLESVDLTPELMHGPIKPTLTEDLKAEYLKRPASPVPPKLPSQNIEQKEEPDSPANKSPLGSTLQIPQIKADDDLSENLLVNSFVENLVAKSADEALERVVHLSPDEWNELKHQDYESSNDDEDENAKGVEFQQNGHLLINEGKTSHQESKQPGEVGGSAEVECGGEKRPICEASVVQSLPTISSSVSPQDLGVGPTFRSEEPNLGVSTTQSDSLVMEGASHLESPPVNGGCVERGAPGPPHPSSRLPVDSIRVSSFI